MQFLVDADGRKTAVVLQIDDFRALVERLEELEDLRLIEERKSEPRLDIASLEDLLAYAERIAHEQGVRKYSGVGQPDAFRTADRP